MSKDDFFAWLQTGAGIESEQTRLEIMAKAEEVFSTPIPATWQETTPYKTSHAPW